MRAGSKSSRHGPTPGADKGVSRGLGLVLSGLVVFGPISMDLYLPVLPALTESLNAHSSAAQLTLGACLLGLAVGQVLAGPVSDRIGRRRVLLWGIGIYVVASVLCAMVPTVETLIVARLIQGLAGAVGLVIAMAAGRDLFEGRVLLGYYGRMTILSGTAAIFGPVIGGQLAKFTDWRGIFVFLAVVGSLLFVATLIWVGETLPVDRRVSSGSEPPKGARRLWSDPTFVVMVSVVGLMHAATFAYLAGATYVLQEDYGLSPQGYSYAFAANSATFVLCGWAAGRHWWHWTPFGRLASGAGMCAGGSVAFLIGAILGLSLFPMLVVLAMMVGGVAVAAPPATTMAMEAYPDIAGTASAVLGLAKFAPGVVSAPLVGLGGTTSAVSLGIVMATAMAMVCACLTLTRGVRRRRLVRAERCGLGAPKGVSPSNSSQ